METTRETQSISLIMILRFTSSLLLLFAWISFRPVTVTWAFSVLPPSKTLLAASMLSSMALHEQSTATQHHVVLEAIDELFPPQGLDQRIALSRKDGYWPFISSGDEPPQEFVYGEFDTAFFAKVLERAGELLVASSSTGNSKFKDWVFCDLGSGTGRLVFTAAALFPWKLCRGIELLEGIHNQALEKLETCCWVSSSAPASPENAVAGASNEHNPATETMPPPSSQDSAYWKQYQQYTNPTDDAWLKDLSTSFGDNAEGSTSLTSDDTSDEAPLSLTTSSAGSNDEDQEPSFVLYHSASDSHLPLAPIKLKCGSFTDPYEFFGDANIVFVYSSAMPYHILIDLARAVGRQCKPGTLVITTEYQLPTGGTMEPVEDDPGLPYGEYEMELVETLTGENESTGGLSTVYIQRLVKSLGDGVPKSPPVLSVSEIAFRVIQKLERGELNNPQHFLRNVSNQMAFLGLPESWRPKLKE